MSQGTTPYEDNLFSTIFYDSNTFSHSPFK